MITTTIYKILIGELSKKNNFYRDDKTNKIIYLSDESFMDKIIKYDEDVDDITSQVFFNNNYLLDTESDIAFKYLWVSNFLDRQIKYQSFSIFTAKNTALFYQYGNTILSYFKDFDKYLINYNETISNVENNNNNNFTSNNSQNNILTNNSIFSTQPQTEININLDNDTMSYADNNSISKTNTNNNSNTITSNISQGKNNSRNFSKNYDLNKLILYQKSNILKNILDEFDKKCFLQVW